MAGNDNSPKAVARCPTCGKGVAANRRAGSLTSYLFGAFDCACSRPGTAATAQAGPDSDYGRDDTDFCPKCGLRIAKNTKDGSLTGFLFQSTRCTCPVDQSFADGKMSDRFRKMKQAGAGTTFASASVEATNSSATSIGLATGATIGGAYKIIELIGRGGMGEVYLARHETLGKKCALKVIPPEEVTELGWLRFQLEARAVAQLEHINLVRVTDLGIDNGCLPFYAMDYVEGKTLADLLAESGPIPLPFVLDIFTQVCDGVDCAHRNGILHRDLKPANIMVVPAKTGTGLAKVLDFGLAKLTKHDRTKQSLTAVGDVFGSPFYMSPEQCSGQKLDNRSDIYSLGCTMFECLTGQPPFSGDLASAIMFCHQEADPPSLENVVGKNRFPASMEIVIAKLLRKNPVERYQTLLELRSDLEKMARGADIQPFYVSRSRPTQEKATATIAATDRSKSAAAAGKTPINHQRATIATATLIIAVGLAAITYYLNAVRPPSTTASVSIRKTGSTGLKQQSSESTLSDGLSAFVRPAAVAQTPGLSLNEIKPYSREAVKDRKSIISFDFPSDFAVGILHTEEENTQLHAKGRDFHSDFAPGVMHQEKQTANLLAKGHLEFPAGTKLQFFPDPSVVKYPQYLSRFRPGDLDKISLGMPTNNNAMIKAVTNFKGLEGLELSGCDDIDDKSIPDLSKLKSLTRLETDYSGITGAGLARLPFLKQLTLLSFTDGENASQLCQALAGSTAIKRLYLRGTVITPSAFKAIGTLKNLSGLSIDGSPVRDADLLELAKLPYLNKLSAIHCKINHNQIAILKKFRSLKVLVLDTAQENSLEKTAIRKSLDTVEVL